MPPQVTYATIKSEVEPKRARIEAIRAEREIRHQLAGAKPDMEAAAAAVDCISKSMLTELKSMAKPPAGVDLVTAACLVLVEREYKNHKWDRAKKMMANVDQFKTQLQEFRGEDISEERVFLVSQLPGCEFLTELRRRGRAASPHQPDATGVSVSTFYYKTV